MSKQIQNLSYPEQFLVRRGSLESWGKYIEDYKQKHKVDEYIVPSGQLIAVKETKEDKNYRLKLGNGIDDFYTLSYLDTDLEDKLNQEIQDRITSDEELLANDLVILNEAKQYADDLISGALKRVIVEELPTEDIDLNTIYMVLRPESEPNNIYDEYMYIDDEWEKLGSTEINLDDYYTKDEVNSLLDDKQDIISVTGHITKDDDTIGTESNKVYPAVMQGDNISTDPEDYPNLQFGDIAIKYNASDGNHPRIWFQHSQPSPYNIRWQEIDYSKHTTIKSTNNPPTLYGGLDIGDIWIKYIIEDNETTYQVFICVNRTDDLHPPYNYTWIDITSTDLSNYYTKSEIDNLLNSKQDTITVSGHITKSGNNIDTEANKVYPAIYINRVLSKQTSDYPNIKKNDLIVESEIMNNPLTSVKIARVKFDPSTTFEIEILSSTVVINDVPPTEQYGSSGVYTVDQIVVSKNGNFYRCVTAVRDSDNLYTYTWQTYGTDLTNYYTKTETDSLLGNKEDKLEAGDGLKRVGNVISVKLDTNFNLLSLGANGLSANAYSVGASDELRQTLTGGGTENTRLAKATDLESLGNALSISIDSQTYVMTLQLKHNNQVLSTGTVDLPLETMVVDADYDSQTKEIVLTLQSGSTVRFSVADLVSGLVTESDFEDAISEIEDALADKQDTIDNNNKLDADLVDDTNTTNKFTNTTEKTTWNNKADNTTISTDTTSTTVSLTLADNNEYRYTQDLTSLTLTMPSGDFIASVVFSSGSTPTSMTYDSSIKWSGTDVTSNAFVPQANMEYEIVFWYNGLSINAVVRGVA